MADFYIRYGELIDVYGRSTQSKGFTFVPARIQLSGTMLESGQHFDEHPKMPRAVMPEHADAAFVRARIPSIFGYTPVYDEEREKSLLSEGFVAVLPDERRPYRSSAAITMGALR